MKFLVFTDIHEDKIALKKLITRAEDKDIDFVICCGDLSTFGRGLRYVLKSFNNLKKPFYVIPGNHEEGEGFPGIVKEYEHCVYFHKKSIKIGEYILLGYGGDGFSIEDSIFRKISREWYGKYNGKKIILVTHGPPAGTKLDFLGERNVGNVDYRKFIVRIKPKLAISGHLHETVGLTDKLGKTHLVNPGWEGKVIELK